MSNYYEKLVLEVSSGNLKTPNNMNRDGFKFSEVWWCINLLPTTQINTIDSHINKWASMVRKVEQKVDSHKTNNNLNKIGSKVYISSISSSY